MSGVVEHQEYGLLIKHLLGGGGKGGGLYQGMLK